MNDENSPNVTWANTFVRVNYHLCRTFQCHIIFVANQMILGKVFKMPRDRKKTFGSCNGDRFVNEKVLHVQPPAMVYLD